MMVKCGVAATDFPLSGPSVDVTDKSDRFRLLYAFISLPSPN